MAKKDKPNLAPVIENRRARHDYHIGETLEVGIALQGSEVKAIRAGRISLAEGYVAVRAEPPSLTLLNVDIGEYAPSANLGHRPTRARGLLARRREIVKLAKAVVGKGRTIVPLKLYFKRGWAKLLIGVAQGKKDHDKRESIAKRDAQRDIARAMSRRR
jgi:SsrA-binding protein